MGTKKGVRHRSVSPLSVSLPKSSMFLITVTTPAWITLIVDMWSFLSVLLPPANRPIPLKRVSVVQAVCSSLIELKITVSTVLLYHRYRRCRRFKSK